jgi:hypothetical protein
MVKGQQIWKDAGKSLFPGPVAMREARAVESALPYPQHRGRVPEGAPAEFPVMWLVSIFVVKVVSSPAIAFSFH